MLTIEAAWQPPLLVLRHTRTAEHQGEAPPHHRCACPGSRRRDWAMEAC